MSITLVIAFIIGIIIDITIIINSKFYHEHSDWYLKKKEDFCINK